jgi:crossover junction endodeoxyribonuclease RuvC
MVVIGVDVGLRTCGYVICTVKNLDISLLQEGQIQPNPSLSLPEKLGQIYDILENEVARYTPQALVAEKLYSHHKHPTTLGVLAQVRGVVALLAHKKNLRFFEYSPTRARKSFLGKGRSNSLQVKKMAENITNNQFMSLHTADAYSLIVAFSHTEKVRNLFPDLLTPKNYSQKNKKLRNALPDHSTTRKKGRTSNCS